MKKLLLGLMMILSVSLFSQPQLTYRFNNAQLTNGGTTLEFDVEVKCDVSGQYLMEHTVSIDYGSAGFGSNVAPDHATITKGTLLQGDFYGTQFYDLAGFANTNANTLGISALSNWTAQGNNALWANEVPTTFGQMFHYVIDIQDPSQVAEIQFNQGFMDGQQYQYTTPGVPELFMVPNLYDNDLLTFPLGGGALGTEWTGAVSAAWDDAGNWTAGVPADGVDVNIPDVSKAPFPVITTSAVTGALTVASGAMLTVAPGGDLTTNGLFTNDGDFDITSDGFGFSGSFIDNGGLAGTGNYQFTRNIVTVADSGDLGGWHFLASPLGSSFSNWNMYDYWVNTWDEVGQTYVHMTGDLTVPCDPAPQTTLAPMVGWSVKYDNAYLCNAVLPGTGTDIVMAGPFSDVNTGAFTVATTFTAGTYSGYNLVGNPYSSSIDAASVDFTGTNLDGTINVYDDMSADFIEWSSAVPTISVPPTQGFFVHATAAGNFNLTGAERVNDATAYFYKESFDNLVELQVSGNDYNDNIYIKFEEGTSTGYDLMKDAEKMFTAVPSVPQIYTTSGGQELAIDVQEAADLVPMAFKVGVEGTYTIEAVETSNFENVVLEDTFTGIETDLLADSYTFNYTTGDDPNRFVVHFTALGTPELEANSIHIWASDRNIYVTVPATVTGDVAVYNMMGQEVVANKVIPGMNVIPVNDVNTYYVVKVMSNNNIVTEKVFIK